MRLSSHRLVLPALCVVLCAPTPAPAVDALRTFSSTAINGCQGALPVYDHRLRKGAISVRNTSSANAYVNCAFDSQGRILEVTFFVSSTSDFDTPLRCVGMTGINQGPRQFVAKTVQIPARGVAFIRWASSDFSGFTGEFPDEVFSITCLLAPDIGLDDSRVVFDENVSF